MDKVTIRRARPEDKETALRINEDVFAGRDYLPAYYDHFLASPDMFPAVMLFENRIIAFDLAHIIDDGESVVLRAGRVHQKFQGKGVIKYFNHTLSDWATKKGVKRVLFTMSDANPSVFTQEFQNLTKHLMTRQFPMYYFAGQGLRFLDEDIRNTNRLNIVSDIQLSQYFKSKEISQYISPGGRLIVDAVPYKLIEANIQSMVQPREFTVVYSDIKEEADKCSGLLSFGLVFPTPQPQYKYVLDMFGSDTKSLRIHIVKHLLRLREKTDGVTAMLVFVPEELDIRLVDTVFEEYGITRHPHKSANPRLKSKQLYAFEGIGPRQGLSSL